MSSEISRDDALRILGFMGIYYTPQTKLSSDTLAEKLTKALDFIQRVADLVPKRVNPSSLESWNTEKPLLEIFRECSLEECAQNMFREQMTGNRNAPLFTDVFMDVRQSLIHIALNYTSSKRSTIFLIEDEKQSYSITLRIVDLHSLKGDTPLLSLLYAHGSGSGISRAYTFLSQRGHIHIPVQKIAATLLEQKLLIKILDQNSQRVASSFKPKRHASEKTYTRSFILPLRALTMENIGTLTKAECVLCGISAVSRCSACQSVGYCGKECQTADWKSHKKLCKPLSSGTWRRVSFSLPKGPSGEIALMAPLNRHSMPSELGDRKPIRSDEAPLNVHGTAPFIVKIQIPLGHGFGMMVYDRRRSFTGCISLKENPVVYAQLEDAVKRRGVNGLKMYRWAKMIGDWTLDICLDVEPKEPIQW